MSAVTAIATKSSAPAAANHLDKDEDSILHAMVKTLQKAIDEIARLPDADQEEIGRKLLSHIEKLRQQVAEARVRAIGKACLVLDPHPLAGRKRDEIRSGLRIWTCAKTTAPR
jgi:hypothetical protein